MNISHQIEPTSTDHLLTCLGLAIDEAKLEREIVYLETELSAVRRQQKENRVMY